MDALQVVVEHGGFGVNGFVIEVLNCGGFALDDVGGECRSGHYGMLLCNSIYFVLAGGTSVIMEVAGIVEACCAPVTCLGGCEFEALGHRGRTVFP